MDDFDRHVQYEVLSQEYLDQYGKFRVGGSAKLNWPYLHRQGARVINRFRRLEEKIGKIFTIAKLYKYEYIYPSDTEPRIRVIATFDQGDGQYLLPLDCLLPADDDPEVMVNNNLDHKKIIDWLRQEFGGA